LSSSNSNQGSSNSNQGSSSISPVGSVSPSSAHFPDSIKDDWDSENSEEDEESKSIPLILILNTSPIFLNDFNLLLLAKIKRKKFAELRAKHYNMKEALRLGHKLVEEDVDDEENGNTDALNDDDDEGNEIDNNNDYNNSSSSNNGITPMET
jgi:hypothetical protein